MPAKEPEVPFYRYEWKTVAGVRTLLMKVGANECTKTDDTERLFSPDTSSSRSVQLENRVALIVPGNPGSIQFYQDFAVALWENLDRKVPVWGISHAGHVFHEHLRKEKFDASSYPQLKFQIEHKKWFIDHLIPPNFKEIILIGHSIGAYVCMRVADELASKERITRVIGLFPTIERMALSPHGRIFTPLVKYGRWLLFAAVFGISWLPESLHRYLFRRYLPYAGDHHFEGAKSLARLPSFRNSILMAKEEMEIVTALDHELVRRLIPRTILYYGQADHWCPVEYHTEIKQLIPDGQFHLCEKGYEHAFVLRDSVPMADLVAEWIKSSDGSRSRTSVQVVD